MWQGHAMQASVRFALVGIAALAGLSAVHWARDEGMRGGALGDVIGFAPNLFASIAITFVILGAWSDRMEKHAGAWKAGPSFLAAAAVSGVGLIGWEFVQRASTRFVFDGADIAATGVGLIVSALIFRAIAPRS